MHTERLMSGGRWVIAGLAVATTMFMVVSIGSARISGVLWTTLFPVGSM